MSCSSQPHQLPSSTVKEADNLYRVGKRFALQDQHESALRSFNLAFDRYSLVDHIEGTVLSRIAIIGILAKLQDIEAVNEKTEELTFFIENAAPEFKPNLLLLRIETAYLAGEFEKIITDTNKFKSKDVVIESQILCYRMMARLEQNLSARGEYRRLKRNTKSLRKAHRKRAINDLGIYSFVNYMLGYYQVKQNNWNGAVSYFKTSLEADRTNDNTNGIGKNLYYLAVVHENLNNNEQAKVYYERALNIFKQLDDKSKVDIISKKLHSL